VGESRWRRGGGDCSTLMRLQGWAHTLVSWRPGQSNQLLQMESAINARVPDCQKGRCLSSIDYRLSTGVRTLSPCIVDVKDTSQRLRKLGREREPINAHAAHLPHTHIHAFAASSHTPAASVM